ncbi:hypothetical protein Hanom_Chr15g01353771 [Helianthus anomalus]
MSPKICFMPRGHATDLSLPVSSVVSINVNSFVRSNKLGELQHFSTWKKVRLYRLSRKK